MGAKVRLSEDKTKKKLVYFWIVERKYLMENYEKLRAKQKNNSFFCRDRVVSRLEET